MRHVVFARQAEGCNRVLVNALKLLAHSFWTTGAIEVSYVFKIRDLRIRSLNQNV